MSSGFPFQHYSSPFCWSCASTLWSPPQIFFPLVSGLMAQADTIFPKVRRKLFYVSPLIFGFCGQHPRCFTGTSLLPFCLFLRPILKIWCIGVTLMRISWANHSKRWLLVSNVSITYDGFCEFNTSDWFPCAWTLPQNRWRLRRLHIWRYATHMSCKFQRTHCTFINILSRPFAWLFCERCCVDIGVRLLLISGSAQGVHPWTRPHGRLSRKSGEWSERWERKWRVRSGNVSRQRRHHADDTCDDVRATPWTWATWADVNVTLKVLWINEKMWRVRCVVHMFINLAMCIRALFSKSPEWIGARSFEVPFPRK